MNEETIARGLRKRIRFARGRQPYEGLKDGKNRVALERIRDDGRRRRELYSARV
jgi:hypothetical protein